MTSVREEAVVSCVYRSTISLDIVNKKVKIVGGENVDSQSTGRYWSDCVEALMQELVQKKNRNARFLQPVAMLI